MMNTTFAASRCPHCVDLFKKNPDFYIKRLSENIPIGVYWIMRDAVLDQIKGDSK